MVVEQIPLPLGEQLGNSADYFVTHSGVVEALSGFESALHRLGTEPEFFQSFYIFGASGVGKSHLLTVMKDLYSRSASLAPNQLLLKDLADMSGFPDSSVGEFVSEYEGLKTCGGIFVTAARLRPENLSQNPHLLSRLKGSAMFELKPPSIDELRPTLQALLERKNLRLSDRNLEYLIRRVPTNPLSLWGILARIDDRALREGRTVSLHFIREILGEI